MVLPELLKELYVRRLTGLLHIAHGAERVSLRFVDGEILNGSSTSHKGRLGETMVRHGLLELKDLVRALVVVHRDKKRLGPVLKEMGVIDTRRLDEAIALHRREMLLTALAWTEATHTFENQDPSGERGGDALRRSCTGELILEFVRSISSPAMVRLGLGDLDRIPVAASEPRFRLEQITLHPAEGYVLSRLDGRVSARGIIEGSAPLPAENVERSLLGLLCTGVIEYLPQAPGAPRGGTSRQATEHARKAGRLQA